MYLMHSMRLCSTLHLCEYVFFSNFTYPFINNFDFLFLVNFTTNFVRSLKYPLRIFTGSAVILQFNIKIIHSYRIFFSSSHTPCIFISKWFEFVVGIVAMLFFLNSNLIALWSSTAFMTYTFWCVL